MSNLKFTPNAKKQRETISREQVDLAMKQFISNGGEVTKINNRTANEIMNNAIKKEPNNQE